MLLYDTALAPNPRRVRIFLAEKGIEIPTVQIDIGKRENLDPSFLEKNPLGRVPVLELDDGRILCESVAICRYFEGRQPEPRLMGIDAEDAAFVEMWNRRMELEILRMTADCFRHTHAFFRGRVPQIPDYGELCRSVAGERLAWLDGELADRAFIAGDRFSIADITALVGIDFGRPSQIGIAPSQKNLVRWYEGVSSRPSASA
jgi:glutathione S-transferase